MLTDIKSKSGSFHAIAKFGNIMQHFETWCSNDRSMLHPTILPTIVVVCKNLILVKYVSYA